MRDDPPRAVGGGQWVKRPQSADAWAGRERKSYPLLKPKKSKTRKSRCTNDDQLLNKPPDPHPDGHFAEGQDMVLNPRFDQFQDKSIRLMKLV